MSHELGTETKCFSLAPGSSVSEGRGPDKVECFSDYMTLQIPSSRIGGFEAVSGQSPTAARHLDGPQPPGSSSCQCGYFLYPAPDADFIFRARYSACFVQNEKENYRLEIRLLHKGVKRLERSKGYTMKCPVTVSRLARQSVHCGPTFIRVSQPLPLRSDSRQGPNTSAELLPLWLVSGHYACPLQAVCPPVSSQPGSEVLVHIPKQRVGLVKRGSHFEEALSLKSLHVHQPGTFTVMESRDFLVVSILGAALLQVQPCQEARGAPGTQAFYPVDLSLEFAESQTPVLWTVENHFQFRDSVTCLDSHTEDKSLLATPRTRDPSSSMAAHCLFAVPEHRPCWPSPAAPGARVRPANSQVCRSKLGVPCLLSLQSHSRSVLSPGSARGNRATSTSPCFSHAELRDPGSPRPSQPVSAAPTVPATHLPSEASSSPSPSWRSEPLEVSLGSGPSVTLTEGPQQDPAHSTGSPLPLGGLSGVDVSLTEPTQVREEFQPLMKPLVTRVAEEVPGSHHTHRTPREVSPMMEVEGPPERGHGIPGAVFGGHPDPSPPKLSQGLKGLRLTILPGMDATLTTQGGWQRDTSAHLGTSGPEPRSWHLNGSDSPVTSGDPVLPGPWPRRPAPAESPHRCFPKGRHPRPLQAEPRLRVGFETQPRRERRLMADGTTARPDVG